jgi:hypothetical protein
MSNDELTPQQKFNFDAEAVASRALLQGRSREDVIAELIRHDWSLRAASALVARVANDLRRYNESPESRLALVPFPLGKFRAPMVNSNKDLWPGRTGLVQKGPARRPAVQNGQENA